MLRRAFVGSKKFEAILPAEPDIMVAIVDAFNKVLDKVLKLSSSGSC